MVAKHSTAKNLPSNAAARADTTASKIRVQLDFSKPAFERLEHLQKKMGDAPRADVVRSGLALLDWVLQNVEVGEPVTMQTKDGELHTLYLPWHWAR